MDQYWNWYKHLSVYCKIVYMSRFFRNRCWL